MRVLRTPEDRFTGLPGFGYEPRYADLGELRMAYVEAGPPDGEPVLLLHGEPSWSFLYRAVMPVLAAAGYRAIAPDLIGFGRSDKPAEIADHSYARHVEWVGTFAFGALGLRGITLVGHDWGGLIGLRLVAEHGDRFARVVAANTGLPTGDHPMPDVWYRFREAVRTAPDLSISRLVQAGCQRRLPDAVLAAYDAPFPGRSYQAGPRAMPDLVPATPDDPAAPANRAAWQRLATWDKPFLVAFSDRDPITGGMAPILARAIPARRASGIRSSPVPATSCRRTRARNSARRSLPSCAPTPPRPDGPAPPVPAGRPSHHHRMAQPPPPDTYLGPMEENRARHVTDALRARGINAHLARVGVDQFGVRVSLPDGREAEWDTDGTAGLEAQVMQDGDLVGFIPEIDGSEDFTEEQVIDAIARADYDEPIGHERAEAPQAGPELAPEGGVFRRFRDGFRYR